MQIGVVFPQTEYTSDPQAIKEYAQTAEELGFTHILAYDHVLGANPDRPERLTGPYTYQDPFREPFVLFAFMAALTTRIEFATGILILPQRQTALVAKQAADLDVLSGGRLRLGIGIGWNPIEYIALNEDFHTRGKRSEEQVDLLRKLWTEPLVSYQGRWHTVPDAGINPLPVQRPIPIWFGGHAQAVLERTARLGDGWMTNYRTPEDARPSIEALQHFTRAAGRSPGSVGIEARIHYDAGENGAWENLLAGWQAEGATHITFNTMRAGFETPQAHLAAIEKFAQVAGAFA